MEKTLPSEIKPMDRPSKHGKILGEALALLAMAGRKDCPAELPPMCVTCAFREGTMPNMCAGTGLLAFNCALGIDKDRFACHHGMKDGQPAKLCVGYVAARLAPWSFTKEVITELGKTLDAIDGEGDDVRTAFDAWLSSCNPETNGDIYQIARKFNKATKDTSASDSQQNENTKPLSSETTCR